MKKIIIVLFMAIVALNTKATSVSDVTAQKTVTTSINETKLSEKEMERMINRLKEMRAIDASSLSKAQKHELRKEVLSIKAKMMDLSGGVYISAGTLIIIIILLIIFL